MDRASHVSETSLGRTYLKTLFRDARRQIDERKNETRTVSRLIIALVFTNWLRRTETGFRKRFAYFDEKIRNKIANKASTMLPVNSRYVGRAIF